uniref:Putative secreted protein n=1 Tax=Ixodes ricinus TaxID=34613 RepID=A0A6B0UD15_IXORI
MHIPGLQYLLLYVVDWTAIVRACTSPITPTKERLAFQNKHNHGCRSHKRARTPPALVILRCQKGWFTRTTYRRLQAAVLRELVWPQRFAWVPVWKPSVCLSNA